VADGVDGAHRPCGDHDLFGHGGDATLGVAVGERLTQGGQAGRIVAVGVGVRGQLFERSLDASGEPWFGCRQGGAAQVDHRAERFRRQRFQAAGGQRIAGRYSGPATRSPAGFQEAFTAQRFVRGGHGGAADRQGKGEFTFGGEPGGDGNAAFEDEQPDAVREGAIRRRPAGARSSRSGLLGGELPGELSRTYRRGPLCHGSQSTFLELAMVGVCSIATECHVPVTIARRGLIVSAVSAHLTRRLLQLYVGLALYGVSSALLVRGGLGLEPWGVLHQGLAEHTGLTIGVVSIIVGAAVLLLWIPIKQRPGLGTVSNVFVIGVAMDGTLAVVPAVHGLVAQIPVLAAGIVLNGVATGLYIAARFGPGPRDGLMTGLHRLTGRSVRLVRTGIEVAVVATGFALGGSVGIGTVAYALAIGPLAQVFLRVFAISEGTGGSTVVAGGTPERAILRD
jgi:uncharacterized membrane protein YczE